MSKFYACAICLYSIYLPYRNNTTVPEVTFCARYGGYMVGGSSWTATSPFNNPECSGCFSRHNRDIFDFQVGIDVVRHAAAKVLLPECHDDMGLAQIKTLMVSLMFVGEVEGRRKILRGRKTITRTYYKPSAIPAWAIVTIVAFVEIIIGAVAYFVLNRFYIGDLTKQENYIYRPANTSKA